jgi:hypothetical protein
MSEDPKTHIGKYVCYNAVDGGMCWGRIKAVCKINTMSGEKPAFILDGRVVGYLKAKSGLTIKMMKPGCTLPYGTKAMNQNNGQTSDDLEIEVRRIKGDTLLRLDVIDIQRDIITIDEALSKISDDALFIMLVSAKAKADSIQGGNALEIGLSELMGEDGTSVLKQELSKRMEKKQ